MNIFHEREVAKARKDHVCDWCGDGIEKGHPYRSYRWADDSDSGYVEMHPECHTAMQSDLYVERDDRFTPYSHCRGCTCERPRCECGEQANGRKQDENP